MSLTAESGTFHKGHFDVKQHVNTDVTNHINWRPVPKYSRTFTNVISNICVPTY